MTVLGPRLSLALIPEWPKPIQPENQHEAFGVVHGLRVRLITYTKAALLQMSEKTKPAKKQAKYKESFQQGWTNKAFHSQHNNGEKIILFSIMNAAKLVYEHKKAILSSMEVSKS
ncbi:hypothetical protein L1987_10242 [Smallanthus sonchifolius]|uniref:Uncharacterized protein n=1 Tax=Smallanthus sonchifolius TaxID=185202 RepID=A0ACB9JRS0_9ASTR|nr:hypothetical protein L1987_10242 [Smallanthus sonchifolius]